MVDQIHICRQALVMDHHHIHRIHHELLVSELQKTKNKKTARTQKAKEKERMKKKSKQMLMLGFENTE